MTVWKIFAGCGPNDGVAVEISYLDFPGILEHQLSTFMSASLGCGWLCNDRTFLEFPRWKIKQVNNLGL